MREACASSNLGHCALLSQRSTSSHPARVTRPGLPIRKQSKIGCAAIGGPGRGDVAPGGQGSRTTEAFLQKRSPASRRLPGGPRERPPAGITQDPPVQMLRCTGLSARTPSPPGLTRGAHGRQRARGSRGATSLLLGNVR